MRARDVGACARRRACERFVCVYVIHVFIWTAGRIKGQQMNVDAKIAEIKAHMPEVYKGIQDKAAEMGKSAYSLVRRGLRGEANCFYAFEAGRVVGAPFTGKNLDGTNIQDEVARYLVQFGATHVVIFGNSTQGESNGAN